MSIIKNDIPILEFDTDLSAIVMPDHEHLNITLPAKAAFAFLGDAVDRYARAHGAVVAAHFVSATKNYPVYILPPSGTCPADIAKASVTKSDVAKEDIAKSGAAKADVAKADIAKAGAVKASAAKADIANAGVAKAGSEGVSALDVKCQPICLVQAPVGAPAAAQILDWLIAYGVREIISAGSCGVLTDMAENTFLVPYKALRDEGTSYHYLPPARFVKISKKARIAIEQTLGRHGLPYREVVTWSTDGFYRETKEKADYRKSEGCEVVEMECSALAACAQMRGAVFGELLFTADTLVDAENYDARNWGGDSVEYALELCIEAARNI